MRFLAKSNPKKICKTKNVTSNPVDAAKEIPKEPRILNNYFSTHSVWSTLDIIQNLDMVLAPKKPSTKLKDIMNRGRC